MKMAEVGCDSLGEPFAFDLEADFDVPLLPGLREVC